VLDSQTTPRFARGLFAALGVTGDRVEAFAVFLGFFAAHAVWSVSDGEVLVPIYAYVDAQGQRHMERLEADDLAQATADGRSRLENNPYKASYAVLIVDAFITLSSGKTDALLVEGRYYGSGAVDLTMAIPCKPAKDGAKFVVYRPKIYAASTNDQTKLQAIMESFWEGVDTHEKAADVWNRHLDQSQ
jgi:hypothetical protein